MEIYSKYQSPVGIIYIRCTDHCLTGLWFEKQAHFPSLEGIQEGSNFISEAAVQWLSDYFAGIDPGPFHFPINPKGTPFQQSVWQKLQRIPYGKTSTYKQVARELGIPKACQAVGNAVGRNPISIIIPCHRVLGTDGSLTGYAGGLKIKEKLLLLENSK